MKSVSGIMSALSASCRYLRFHVSNLSFYHPPAPSIAGVLPSIAPAMLPLHLCRGFSCAMLSFVVSIVAFVVEKKTLYLRVSPEKQELLKSIRDLIDIYEASEDDLINEVVAYLKYYNSRKKSKSK